MRIIAGEFRSRLLKAPAGLTTRPTPDRLRESLFNIIAARIEGCVFLDGYAGSGAVGLEALSRGARHVILVERGKEALEVLKENLKSLRVDSRVKLIAGNVPVQLKKHPADIVFLDPPYDEPKEYERCLEALGEQAPSLVIVQHNRRYQLPEAAGLLVTRTLQQGDNVLTFLEPSAAEELAEEPAQEPAE